MYLLKIITNELSKEDIEDYCGARLDDYWITQDGSFIGVYKDFWEREYAEEMKLKTVEWLCEDKNVKVEVYNDIDFDAYE